MPALAIGAMVYYKVPHPPAAACAAVYATLGDPGQQTPLYLLLVLLGCAYMLAVQWFMAALLRGAPAVAAALTTKPAAVNRAADDAAAKAAPPTVPPPSKAIEKKAEEEPFVEVPPPKGNGGPTALV